MSNLKQRLNYCGIKNFKSQIGTGPPPCGVNSGELREANPESLTATPLL